MNIQGKRVMVTGGSGFLGRNIVSAFERKGAEVAVLRSREYSLVDPTQTREAFKTMAPQIVVHAAADVGGIGYNQLSPADIFQNNLLMTANVLRAAQEAGIDKLVIISSACAYPGEVEGDMKEEEFLEGPLHPSVECYGFSKRALYIGAKAFKEQYGLNSIILVLTNLYGPWDKYNPRDSHVVAALIKKFVEAKQRGEPEVECWGTGKPVREFLYVEDCADAVVRATEVYDSVEPLNVGTGIGTSILELSEIIPEVVGYTGSIVWNADKPDGAMRKVLDVSRMKSKLGWESRTSFKDGLRKTIDWYVEHQEVAAR